MADETNYKLAVANRFSFWDESYQGHLEYGKPSNFLNFTSENNPTEQRLLYDGMTWCYNKIILKIDTPKPAPYLFIKKLSSGRASAIYCFSVFAYDASGKPDEAKLKAIHDTCIRTMQQWATDHNQTLNPPVFQSDLPDTGNPCKEDQTLVQTCDMVKPTST